MSALLSVVFLDRKGRSRFAVAIESRSGDVEAASKELSQMIYESESVGLKDELTGSWYIYPSKMLREFVVEVSVIPDGGTDSCKSIVDFDGDFRLN